MLSNTLVTNEVKDSAGSEVEFVRIMTNERQSEFAKVGETPNQPYRMKISHQEIGSGAELRRRSMVRFDKTVIGVSGKPRVISDVHYIDAPIGDISATTDIKNVVANMLSFCATTGAATTVLFDGTGTGAVVIVDGTL